MIRREAPLIGLDVGAARVKAFQQLDNDASPATADFPRLRPGTALDADEAARISDILRRRGFAGVRVALAAPAGMTTTAPLDLPPAASGAPLGVLARAELARLTNADGAEMELAFWPVPRSPMAASDGPVLAVGLPTAAAEAMLAPLDAAGLEPCVVDAPCLAHARATFATASTGIAAIADIGHEAVVITVFCDGTPFYTRRLTDLSLGSRLARWSSELNIDPRTVEPVLRHRASRALAERMLAFAAEVELECQTTCRYGLSQYPSAKHGAIVYVGGGAGLLALVAPLPAPASPGPVAPSLALAAGLSRHGLAAPARGPVTGAAA